MNGFIQTYSGIMVDPLNPDPATLSIIDIAHHLSNLCRFTGAVRRFYSVAEHCVNVSYRVPQAQALAGLLHDASEAYLQDIARPVKIQPTFDAYRAAERNLEKALEVRFGVQLVPMHPTIHVADRRMCRTEADVLLAPLMSSWDPIFPAYAQGCGVVIGAWSPERAENEFLARFRDLTESALRRVA